MKKLFFIILYLLLSATFLHLPAPAEPGITSREEDIRPVKVEIIQIPVQDKDKLKFSINLNIAKGIHVYYSEKNFFQIKEEMKGLKNDEILIPETKSIKDFDGKIIGTFEGNVNIVITKKITDAEWRYSGYFQYQSCSDISCFPPEKISFIFSGIPAKGEKSLPSADSSYNKDSEWMELASQFRIRNTTSGYKNSEDFIKFLSETKDSASQNFFAGKNIFLILLLIIIGGIALNLTPCVLPMIPINLAIIGAGAKAGSKSQGFFIGSIYGLGMAVTYGLTGLIVVLTGSTFGTINSSPWFNISIAVVFIVLALAMFDIITIDFTKLRKNVTQDQQKGRIFTALIMGCLAALLSGACVAPVIISVILYSANLYANGNAAGLLLPFLLGIGMAIPWPIVGAGFSILPKPGKWMEKVKYVFGIIILAIAVYYLVTGINLLKNRGPAPIKSNKTEQLQTEIKPQHSEKILIRDLKRGLKEEKPVLIDFWATWCKSCKTMDNTTFKNEEVQALLESYIFIKFRAEDPNHPKIKKVFDYFKIMGLPTYIILEKKN